MVNETIACFYIDMAMKYVGCSLQMIISDYVNHFALIRR